MTKNIDLQKPLLISMFTDMVTVQDAQPSEHISLEYLVNKGIKTNAYKNQLAKVTKHEYGSKEYKRAKVQYLNYFTPHGTFETRNNASINSLSYVFLHDLDIKDNPEKPKGFVDSFINELENDEFVIAAFKSPGNGVKFFAKYELPTDETIDNFQERFKEYHNSQMTYFELKYEVKLDASQGKLSQPCFISCDKLAFYFDYNKKAYQLTKIVDEPKEVREYKPKNYSSGAYHFIDEVDAAMWVANELRKAHIDITSDFHEWVVLGLSIANLGERGRDVYHNVSSQYGGYSYRETDKQYNYFLKKSTGRVSLGRFFWVARNNGVDVKDFYRQEYQKIREAENASKSLPIAKAPIVPAKKIEVTLSDDKKVVASSFPVNVFPEEIVNIVSGLSKAKHVDFNLLAFGMFNAFSSAMGLNYELFVPRTGWTNTALLFSAMVGDSSIGKTPALKLAYKPLRDYDNELQKVYKDELKQYEARVKAAKKNKEEPPEVPTERHQIVNDSTIEALVQVHSNNPKGLSLLYDEILGFIQGMSNYKNAGVVEKWLSIWSNESIKMTRKTVENSFIDKSYISIFGGIQPKLLFKMSQNGNKDNGFVYRFLFCFADKRTPVKWTDFDPNTNIDHLTSRYAHLLNKLLYRDYKGEPTRISLECNSEAEAIWGKTFDEIDEKLASEESDEVKSVLSKFSQYIHRFALILEVMQCLCKNVEPKVISAEAMTGAIELYKFFYDNSFKVLNLVEIHEEEEQDNKNSNARQSPVDWFDIFGQDKELQTNIIVDRVINLAQSQKKRKPSPRTVQRWIKSELSKRGHGVWSLKVK